MYYYYLFVKILSISEILQKFFFVEINCGINNFIDYKRTFYFYICYNKI